MRYAVIGTGWIVDSYIEGAQLAGGWELAAVCSRNRQHGLDFAGKYGVATVYTTPEELAADPTIQAVYIASPNAFHYPQSKLMLSAGKHVLCEKPITVLPEQCAENRYTYRTRAYLHGSNYDASPSPAPGYFGCPAGIGTDYISSF